MFTLPSVAPIISGPCLKTTCGMDEPEEQIIAHKNSMEERARSPTIDVTIDGESTPKPLQQQQQQQQEQQLVSLDLLNMELLDPEWEDALETMESLVGCVEGVDEQHSYEEKMMEHNRHKEVAVEQHGLSTAEAAMIRLQNIKEEERDDTTTDQQINDIFQDSAIPDMDVLNLCGDHEDLDHAQDHFVLPMADEGIMSCADVVKEDLFSSTKEDATVVRSGTSATAEQQLNALTCSICFDEALLGNDLTLNRVKFANLPCCGDKELSSLPSDFAKVCTYCILVLTSPAMSGSYRIGRCPRCLDWIKVQILRHDDDDDGTNCKDDVGNSSTNKTGIRVEKIAVHGQCLICNQEKEYLVENGEVCDSCFLGRRQPLKYECQQCHHYQNIPHPMYRYQEQQDQFGTVTWACQGKCGRFTNWKILPEETHRIALGDAPRSWGTDYVAVTRERVKILREDLKDQVESSSKDSGNSNNRPMNEQEPFYPSSVPGEALEGPSQCRIL